MLEARAGRGWGETYDGIMGGAETQRAAEGRMGGVEEATRRCCSWVLYVEVVVGLGGREYEVRP